VVAERDWEREQRPCPRSWIRRLLLTAGVTVAAWLLLGGSPAEATPGVSGVSPSTALTDIDAARVAGTADSAGVGIVAPAVASTADRLTGRTADRDAGNAAVALPSAPAAAAPQAVGSAAGSVTGPTAGSVTGPVTGQAADQVADFVTGQPLRRSQPHDTGIDTSTVSSDRRLAGWMGHELDGAVRAVALGDPVVGQSGPTQGLVGPGVTPTLGAVVGTAHPVLDRVNEVIPAMPGEPGVASPNDRETPGLSVEAPHTSTEPRTGSFPRTGFGTESPAAVGDLAHLSSEWPGSPFSRGAITGGSGTGNDAGPALPDPAPPVPGPSPHGPDGTASTASGHGSVDRGQNVATDTSPLVVAPELVRSFAATSRSTGHSERAVRPSVSPD
jgi:hypothetical protein